ncbi:tetratricopeptide repeat protein [Herpetosiphon llansteffanensis]
MQIVGWILALTMAIVSAWWLYHYGLSYRGEYLPFLAIPTVKSQDKPQSNAANTSFKMLQQAIDLTISHELLAAQQLYEQAMQIYPNLSSNDKIAILALAHDYALELNRWHQSIQVSVNLSKIITEQQSLLGIEHIQTLNSMHTLAIAHMRQGNYAQAEALYQTILEYYPKLLNETISEDFIFICADYTHLLLRQARLADIAKFHQQLITIPYAFPEQCHHNEQKINYLLSYLQLLQTNDLTQSVADYRQLLIYTTTHFGETHERTLETSYFLASVLDDIDNPEESRQVLERIYPIYQQKLPINDIFRHELGFHYVWVLKRCEMNAQALAISEILIQQITPLRPPSPWMDKITQQHESLISTQKTKS